MTKKYIVNIVIFVVLISITGFYILFFTRGEPVESEERAIEIAKAYVLEKYNKSF